MENNQTRAVAVVGRTGCGKSTFIRAMMLDGNLSRDNIKRAEMELPKVSSGVQKCTTEPAVYPIPPIDGIPYELVDFMGLQDTDKENQEALSQIARLLAGLPALFGVVYIVDGRMTPAEADDCQFLFNEFFRDVSAKGLLVVRSKNEDWEKYDAQKEKIYLREKIPSSIALAPWIAVNFCRKAPFDESSRQIQSLREKLGRMTQALELSEKNKIAFNLSVMENKQTRAVAVVGRKGCGKSTFIRAMMLDGNLSRDNIKKAEMELPKVSSGVQKCTTEPAVYPIPPIDGIPYELIDFMGLQDTDKENQEALSQIARLLAGLPALFGVVYIIDGRMTPAEIDDCQFLFKELFWGVSAKDLLVVRSKCWDLEQYDASKEKVDLEGKIPETITRADWIAVNFCRQAPLDESSRQIESLRENLSRWTQPLELSDKTRIAMNYRPVYLDVEKYKERSSRLEKELKTITDRIPKTIVARRKNIKRCEEPETVKKPQEQRAPRVNESMPKPKANDEQVFCSVQ